MKTFEEQIDNIQRIETKDNFNEVYKCFSNSSYRATISLLWSTLVTDLILKAKEMDSIFGDPKAKEILDNIKKSQSENAKSSKWELDLVQDMHNKMHLYDSITLSQLEYLQQVRHWCSHPILNDVTLELYKPNKDETSAFIRLVLDHVLTVPSTFSNDVFSEILKEINLLNNNGLSQDRINVFILDKYLKHLPDKLFSKIFEDLWVLAFNKDNSDIQKNRETLVNFISFMYSHNTVECINTVRQKNEKFSNIKNDKMIIMHLVKGFLSKHSMILSELSKSTQQYIDHYISNEPKIFPWAPFKFSNLEDYINTAIPHAKRNGFIFISNYASSQGVGKIVLQKGLEIFSQARNYDDANRIYRDYIQPVLHAFDLELFKKYIEICGANNQISGRGEFLDTMKELIQHIDEKQFHELIDLSKYRSGE